MENENKSEKNVELELYIDANSKEYFKCSMYYMRRFFGIREIVLLSVLFVVGLLLFFLMAQPFVLILFAVCIALILVAFILFLITSSSGYKVDMEKKGISKLKLDFTEDALLVTNIDIKGNPLFMEKHYYDKIEKISIKKKRIYIYAQVSVFYYIFANHYDEQTCNELVAFLKKKLNPEIFKFKKKNRALPKKKKLTLEEE